MLGNYHRTKTCCLYQNTFLNVSVLINYTIVHIRIINKLNKKSSVQCRPKGDIKNITLSIELGGLSSLEIL